MTKFEYLDDSFMIITFFTHEIVKNKIQATNKVNSCCKMQSVICHFLCVNNKQKYVLPIIMEVQTNKSSFSLLMR